MPLKPWNHMHMQVEYVLSCGFAVLLDDADAVCVGGFFDGEGNLLGNFVDLALQGFGDVKYVHAVCFRYDECVSNV